MLKCVHPGCFNGRAIDRECGQCKIGMYPPKRGRVTNNDIMRAEILGGEDLRVTIQRLKDNEQPYKDLEERYFPKTKNNT